MRVPVALANAFGKEFEELLHGFATAHGLVPEDQSLGSTRFLSRSVIPHVLKLSSLFNRQTQEEAAPASRKKRQEIQSAALAPYWKESSNPAHLRLAYLLYFMPSNLFRMAAVWSELHRLGYRWSAGDAFRGIELGAGPASGACGIAAGEKFAPVGLPKNGNWALIEQDKAMLELGSEWAQAYFQSTGIPDWGTRTFHRKLDFESELLPRSAPRFNLWISSYFLNETTSTPAQVARTLTQAWERHLTDEGLVILVEPALKAQSRKLLETRKAIIAQAGDWMQVLLPCLGHQACGALAAPDEGDWCHEEVTWWRPPYYRQIDQLAELDRKTLPFSYLVLAKSKRAIEEILPALQGSSATDRYRLVSPAHAEGRDAEFFICGADGKRRARYRPEEKQGEEDGMERGDILKNAEIRGNFESTRIQKARKI